ncbi:LamG domain-containing protein [Chryseobacterium cheonjiense]|uniref:LamG domain-containing protein n=1 Tax=Chryseobacterium cheonjiense TaxID=2728845 RepID=A0A7Y0A933_9FLAO|nr:hypothetical protein [Chryseobacterium cheonjiense]NML58967.1 LamG domain-containing protein [Chryseobacterium cheonjiense]
MKKYIYLIIILLLSIKAFAQGHLPGTAVPATPNTSPWNGYTAAPDYRQNASVTNAQSTALLPTGSSGTDIFANYLVDTTGYTFYLVYTTNGTVPTKTNGTVVNMSFAVVSGSNRIWAGKIPQQSAGTIVNYVIYVNTTGGTLAAANNRIASSRLGIQATWTEGDTYYSMITPGGVTNTVAWYKADTGLAATTWADQSGHNYNLTRTSAPAGSVTLNFNPVASFTGVTANQYNNTATKAAWPVGSNATTYYYVAKNSAAIANRAALGIGANGASTGFHSGQVATTGLISSAGATAFTTGVATASLASPPDWDNTKSNQGINLVRTGYDSGAGRNYVAAQGSAPTNNTNNVNPTYANTSAFRIGASGDNGIFWNGDVAEVIVFPSQHASTDYLKVESYLALKYGITKTGAYQLSNGTSVYNDATYNNNIAGISRDDASTLNQKQSQSQNSGLQPVIGNVNIAATNTGNANNFSADLSALVWGSDTGNTSFATSFVFGGLNNRMARIWRVQETGTVGNVKVAIPVSQLAGNISSLNLVVSADTTFDGTDTRTAMTLETLGGVQYYTATVDFTSGQFFSFAALVTAPGGVLTNLQLWLKPDSGVTTSGTNVTTWTNQTPAGLSFTQGTVAKQPALVSNYMNFNPGVSFATSGQEMSLINGNPTLFGVNDPMSLFYLANSGSTSGARTILEIHNSSADFPTFEWRGTNFGMDLDGTPFQDNGYSLINTVQANTPYIIASAFNNTNSGGQIYNMQNGVSLNTRTGNTALSVGSGLFLGGNGGGEYFLGAIPEVIGYNAYVNNNTDIQKINTYLAIKYGMTLGSTASTVNYLNSSGNVIWTGDTTYQNNISGIERDDASALNQKQSQSVNTGLQPVIGNVNITDTNANNTNNFTADLSALVWGSDTGNTAFATSFVFGGLNNRVTRIWRVQETGTVGTVKVALPASQITANLSSLSLVVSADATFDGSDTRTAMTLETLGGVQYYTATVDFTTGQFFTFAAFTVAPGGVTNGLTLWMNPDAGIDNAANISTWTDQVNGVVIPRKNTNTTLSINTTLNFNRVVNMPTTGSNGFELPASNSNITRYDPNATDGMSVFGAGVQSTSWNNYGALLSKTDGGAWDNGWVMSTTNISGSNWGLLYVWGNESGTGVGNSAVTSSGSLIRGNAFVASGWWDPALTNKNNIDLDAAFSGSINVATTNSVGSPLGIGYAQGDAFGGQLGDQIYYNRSLSSTERARVQSYLSVKFGTTLGTNALPFNYLNSLGNTIWTGSATYQNNIAGIARDDASGLNQKQSQSALSGLQPVIGNVNITGTNANNTNNFSADLSALVWGSDTGSTSFATSFVFGGLNNRMTRIWRVQETGTVGTVKVALPVSQVQGNATQLNLVVSADATIDGSDTRTAMTLETLGGVQYYTATVDFTTGQFFTFAALATAPGGVFANLRIWLKADDGFTPSSWADRSGNSNDFTQTNASRQPNLIAAGTKYNFNPTVNFGTTGSDARFMVVPSGRPFTANGLDGTFLLTINQNTNSGFRDYLGFGGTTTGSGLTNANDPVFTSNDNGSRTFRIFPYSGATSTTNLQLTAGITYISDVTWRVGVAGGITYGLNGFNGSSGNTFTAGNSLGFNGGILGAQPEVSDAFMSEVIAYERALTAAEMQRVRTYLSIKYGTTLDQSTAQNYLASDGTTVLWNATTNAAYKNNIAGIGRDDTSTLNQKQSQSINSGTQVVIGNGSIAASNAANTNSFAADKSALVWGDNGLPLTYITSVNNNIPSGLNFAYRMSRIWRVQETGTVGTVKVAMRAAAVAYGENAYIIVSSDPTFASGNTWYPLTTTTTINGVTHYTADIDFTSGQYFTFGAKVIGPGGVPGSSLWLRADKAGTYTNNAAVNNWDDVSVNDNDVIQNTAANQPLYKDNTTDNINFNPVMDFDGSNDVLTDADGILGTTTYSNASAFTVNTTRVISNSAVFIESQSTSNQIAMLAPWGDGTTYWDGAFSSRISAAWGGTLNTPYLWTGWNNNSLTPKNSLRRNGLQLASGNTLLNYAGSNSSMNIGPTYNGKIGEVVFNTNALSVNERQRVESYLAIKYGFTLDQTTAQNYLNSASAVIWNATTNAGYNNNIAGVMRDDASGLTQKQSQSVNSGLQPVIGNVNIADTNANNTNSFAADLSSLVWGSDTGSTSFATSFVFGGLTNRMTRIWRVQETGTLGIVKVALPVSQISGGINQLNLVTSADATFDGSDTRTAMTLETLGGVQYYTATVDFTSGQFFSFAALLTGPGGVLGASVWLRADAGTSTSTDGVGISQWNNQSDTNNNAFQATSGNQPLFRTNSAKAINFNPVIDFDGVDDYVDGVTPVQGTIHSLFAIGRTNTIIPDGQTFFSCGVPVGNSNGYAFRIFNDRITYVRGSTGTYNSIVTNFNIVNANQPFQASLTYTNTTNVATIYKDGSIRQTGTISTSANPTNTYSIGSRTVNGRDFYFNGAIPEVVAYGLLLTSNEIQRVNSYLAIKYGLTLDQTTPQNYLASNSTVIWNAATSTGFNNNIFGILRDDVSTLHQRISKSVNSGSVLTLSTDTNFTNANSTHAAIGTDLQSLVIGETTGAYTFTGTALTASGITFSTTEAMAKRWKVQDTGGISCINLRFDATSLPALSGNERYYLIVSDDANFTSNVVYRAVTRTGNNIDVSVNFRDNNVSYFTLAKKDLGISGGDLTDVKSGISTIPSAGWKPTLPNTYLEINSNSKGLVVSRVASTAAIVNPIEGMIIYDLSDNTMKVYTGTIWRKLGDYSTGSNGNINIFCN